MSFDRTVNTVYEYENNKYVGKIERFSNNFLHSKKNKPSIIVFYPDKKIQGKYYHKYGKLNRGNDLPSIELYHPDGIVEYFWYKDDIQHRDEKPAYIKFNNITNKVLVEKYYKYNTLHKEEGSAVINYDNNGKIIKEEKWLYNHRVN